jgi:hypothetical protein
MITARAGSAMTAEIGIQRISEQIDALTAFVLRVTDLSNAAFGFQIRDRKDLNGRIRMEEIYM